jgi:hypothetical protein
MLGSSVSMPARSRSVLLVLSALVALLVAGCGGGDQASSVDESTSVNDLLTKTFSGRHKVDSGRLDLSLNIDVSGSSNAQLQGPISLKLSGPFQSQGKGKLPKFDIDASFEGGGQSLKAGLASTGEKGFVNFNGTEYAVSDQIFQQFRTGYEQAQKQGSGQQGGQSLATLGIDPRRWLTNPTNAGEAKVGDTDAIKITGGVDVSKLLDDINTALDKARSLGVQGTQQLPEKLTDQQKQQAAQAIKNLGVEIYTGKDDSTLRRMLVNMDVNSGGESGKLALDFNLLDLNQDQEIKEPSGAQPFEQLLGQLGGLGLGGSSSSGSGSSGSGSSSGNGGASAEQLKKYSDCVQAAGSDAAKAQKCADILTSP